MKFPLTAMKTLVVFILFHSCANKSHIKEPPEVPLTPVRDTIFTNRYITSFSPSTAILGDHREIFVQAINVETTQTDNKADTTQQLQVSFTLSITNKSLPTSKYFFFLSRSNAFVELNNGKMLPITKGEGFASPDPATTNTIVWSLFIPSNTLPVKLLLYHEQRKAIIQLKTEIITDTLSH